MDANSIRFWSARACSSAVELRTFNPGVVGSNPTGPSKVTLEGPVGFEPTTPGLKVRSSTAELQALADQNRIEFASIQAIVHDHIADNLPPIVSTSHLVRGSN